MDLPHMDDLLMEDGVTRIEDEITKRRTNLMLRIGNTSGMIRDYAWADEWSPNHAVWSNGKVL